jgi:NTE family protein
MKFDDAYWRGVRYLVFSGGAMNGLAYVGVLRVLEVVQPRLYERVQGYAGTSIGALVALLLCIGYTADTMQAVIENFDVSTLLSRSAGMFQNYGMVDAQSTLGAWVATLIQNYMGRPDVNFAELYRRTRQELTVVVTNFTARRVEYWNRHTCPSTSVCAAVTCSMALPLFFTPVTLAGGMYVDGGLGDNFPTGVYPADATLGVRIDITPDPPFTGIIDYGMALLELKRALDSGVHDEGRRSTHRTVCIAARMSAGLNFFVSPAHRRGIVQHGFQAALVWLLQLPVLLWATCQLYDLPWPALPAAASDPCAADGSGA